MHTLTGLLLLAQDGGSGANPLALLIGLAIVVFCIVGQWKVFEKAGEPGWACIVPIYNLVVMMRIVGLSPWWVLGLLIPFVNIIAWIVVGILYPIRLAKCFGLGVVAGIVMIFVPFLVPLIGFSNAQYLGSDAA